MESTSIQRVKLRRREEVLLDVFLPTSFLDLCKIKKSLIFFSVKWRLFYGLSLLPFKLQASRQVQAGGLLGLIWRYNTRGLLASLMRNCLDKLMKIGLWFYIYKEKFWYSIPYSKLVNSPSLFFCWWSWFSKNFCCRKYIFFLLVIATFVSAPSPSNLLTHSTYELSWQRIFRRPAVATNNN